MNSLFLLLAAMVVAVLGYRFFAKLVTLGVFRLSGEYSPGAASPAPVPGELPCPADRLLPYHGWP